MESVILMYSLEVKEVGMAVKLRGNRRECSFERLGERLGEIGERRSFRRKERGQIGEEGCTRRSALYMKIV